HDDYYAVADPMGKTDCGPARLQRADAVPRLAGASSVRDGFCLLDQPAGGDCVPIDRADYLPDHLHACAVFLRSFLKGFAGSYIERKMALQSPLEVGKIILKYE